jgi:hypothetical protein
LSQTGRATKRRRIRPTRTKQKGATMNELTRWLSTGYLTSKPERVDREKGIISGALVVTEGEAKGHGLWLESGFVDEVVAQGNASKSGLKARFGHPNMCSTALGTFLGRWKNFRVETITRNDGSKASAARADLFLSASAKDTPNGDLFDYVLTLAEKDGDMFGTSIVFTRGEEYRRTRSGKRVTRQWEAGKDGYDAQGYKAFRWVDESGKDHDPATDPIIERDYVTCKKLHACDAVDDPAANDGLFSQFAQETVAGQITEFLDLHPQVWTAVENNPEVLAALAQYGDRIDEFVKRYRDYLGHNQGEKAMSDEADAGVAAPEETPATVAKKELKAGAEAADEQENATEESAPEGEQESEVQDGECAPPDGEPKTEQAQESKPLSREEFVAIVDEFGAEIAALTVRDGGDGAYAMRLAYLAAKKENESLRGRVAELESKNKSGGTPVPVTAAREVAPLFRVKK